MLPAVTLFICKPHAFANPAIERDGEICYRIGALGSAPSCAGPSNRRSGTCIRSLVPSASLQRSQPLGVDDSILRSYASSITVRLPDLICYLILPVRFFSHPCTCAGPLVVIVLTPSHNLSPRLPNRERTSELSTESRDYQIWAWPVAQTLPSPFLPTASQVDTGGRHRLKARGAQVPARGLQGGQALIPIVG